MENETHILHSKHVRRGVELVLLFTAIFLAVQVVSDFKEFRFIGGGVPVSNTITVTGEGEVFAVPDIATFSFSVTEERLTVAEAQESAAEKTNTAIKFLKDSDIDEKDIKTTAFNVFPRYEFKQVTCFTFPCPPTERILKGFEVTQTIMVKVRDTEKAGEILSGIGEVGVTTVSGLNFTNEDEDVLVAEARKKAIDAAKEKADVLAYDLDVRLVRIVSFNEFGRGYSPRFSTMESVGGDSSVSSVPEIPTGENKIVSNVSITYEIR
jgi:hypothetical protein|tara:strand:- start:48664 stop:49461 length:798 start_codon:yes stop_codon:yes gene_type:complete